MSVTRLRAAVQESVGGLPRAFWWLWISTLINRLGAFVATFMALYLTQEQGRSASYAGLVAALYGLGGVISTPVAGVLADRIGRRPTLMAAQCGTAFSVALLAFVEDPVAIAAVALLVGMASNASRPAVQAMFADIVPPEDRVRAFALNYWAINMGFGLSAMAAGLIAEYSYRAGFLGEAVLTLACAVVVFLKLPESRPERSAAAEAEEDGVSMRTVVRDGRFMGVVGLSFLISMIFMQGSVGLPVAMGAEGFSPGDYGLVIAVNGLLIVALQIPVTRFIEHRDPRRLLVISALLAGYGFGMTAFAGSLGAYALTVCVWTLAEIVNSPTQMSLVVRLSPVQGRGRYQGMYSMSWAVASLVAPLLAGTVIDRSGAAWLWGYTAALGTVAALGYWLLMRNLPTEDAAPVGTVEVAQALEAAKTAKAGSAGTGTAGTAVESAEVGAGAAATGAAGAAGAAVRTDASSGA
ncbi:MFS transporter [Streptomyces sp. NPDC097619]|uniref:MDR family MFS transporter n=1 Tax=Streptomyces sp. NPDC097619 TaxID=3157228 RepID=UPI003331BEFF